MDATEAARRWAQTWARAWPAKDVESIATLYAEDATYRAHPLREPHPGGGRGYVTWAFADEEEVQCFFGEPIVAGDRAAVEWWATLREGDRDVTLVGATILRFRSDGLVADHRDYWVEGAGRRPPYAAWNLSA